MSAHTTKYSAHGDSATDQSRRAAAQLVANHYNQRQSSTVDSRKDSPIFHLRAFNNWVKAVLMNRFLRSGLHLLDIGCGKGGDLNKYNKARIAQLYAFDVASVSIDQATERYRQMHRPWFKAQFQALDCYNDSIEPYMPRGASVGAVSMQFCAHYAFQSEKQVRIMLENVSRWLAPGGYYFGTVPDANVLVRKLRASPGLEYGNSIYKIRFVQKDAYPVYGHEYSFLLEDAIDDCPEYLIHWPSFVRLAAEYGLEQVEHTNFHPFYHEQADKFRDLLVRMKVVTEDRPELSMDEWEAAGLYSVFVFRKR
ncbi:guanine-N(7)-methyltransferase domain-containing protein [Catenaria anguillulae PL171]|uniref:mRNA cap guanine-N(7) methyltransferase n=1 Tax=Catenaria anguillulae PL171 TaxID=765915 RepID=A0A1Y2HK50_9FUNG|nr:guanine-N(7)-methyltransferase domain-containing protein [Catenaria anguillulae PL171]